MDICESDQALKKNAAVETPRTSLVPADGNNEVSASGRLRTREVGSRYKLLPSRSTPSTPRCSPSPVVTRPVGAPSQTVPKRAQSAERRRPSTPTSPLCPSTPVNDLSVNSQSTSRKISVGKLAEGLWPSTMRSLSVSFQSDSISIPVLKKEKPIGSSSSSSRNSNTPLDRTLRPTSNTGHRQAETPTVGRKPTPEKRSPLKGRNASDQSENSKPVDAVHARLIDQHRWPSRTDGRVSLNSLSSSVDLTDKGTGNHTPISGTGLASMRKNLSSDGGIKPLEKSSSDARLLRVNGSDRGDAEGNSSDNSVSDGLKKIIPTGISDRLASMVPSVRSQSLTNPGLHQPSPSRTSGSSTSLSRGLSPARTRPSTPPSRGTSPSRIRQASSSTLSSNPASVLSFIVDIHKGKKKVGVIEDAHQLRLLYNRHLQWKFTNARGEALALSHKVTAEETLYNVSIATVDLQDSVVKKRINLQQMILELKLFSILNAQMAMLEEWGMMGNDYVSSLAGSVDDLQASTLSLPVTGGARADNKSVRSALCSAMDVLHSMGSSISSLLSRVEEMNNLLSELTMLSAHERARLVDCENLLSSTAGMQVQEHSQRVHILQSKQAL